VRQRTAEKLRQANTSTQATPYELEVLKRLAKQCPLMEISAEREKFPEGQTGARRWKITGKLNRFWRHAMGDVRLEATSLYMTGAAAQFRGIYERRVVDGKPQTTTRK
jgi:hypothetical protein